MKLSKSNFATLIPVKNMDRAVKFYTQKLGGKLIYRDKGKMKDMWASLKLGKEEFWMVAPEKREKRELAYSTFVVKSIRQVVKELETNGVKFEKPEDMGPGSKIEGHITYSPFGANAFFKDSEGNMLMIWENGEM